MNRGTAYDTGSPSAGCVSTRLLCTGGTHPPSSKQGAMNLLNKRQLPATHGKRSETHMTPCHAFSAVPNATVSQSMISVTVKIVPKTLNATESNSVPNCSVAEVNTPIGKVNPHQPMLNGIFSPLVRMLRIDAMATRSHTKPKPQITKATLHRTAQLRVKSEATNLRYRPRIHGTAKHSPFVRAILSGSSLGRTTETERPDDRAQAEDSERALAAWSKWDEA